MSNAKSTPRAELNALLRDGGVNFWCVQGITFWNREDGRECMAYEYESAGEVHLAVKVLAITPAQAIAATVGAGTCRIVWEEFSESYVCDHCGNVIREQYEWDDYQAGRGEKPLNFCPNCGARIEQE